MAKWSSGERKKNWKAETGNGKPEKIVEWESGEFTKFFQIIQTSMETQEVSIKQTNLLYFACDSILAGLILTIKLILAGLYYVCK